MRKRGVLVVKNVFAPWEVSEILSELKNYMKKNGEDPESEEQTFYEIYWSKAQFRARSHQNMLQVQRALLDMWAKDSMLDEAVDLGQLLMYVDRFRMRKPGEAMI